MSWHVDIKYSKVFRTFGKVTPDHGMVLATHTSQSFHSFELASPTARFQEALIKHGLDIPKAIHELEELTGLNLAEAKKVNRC